MTDKATDTAAGTMGAAPDAAGTPPKDQAAPKALKTPQAPKEKERPVRRVGSFTLGLCLIAVGICFLCYYFLPSFNWLLVVKVGAPLALVALGAEVLICAARPGRWKYDFLAVLGCLAIMGCAFCLTLLPIFFWQQVDPARQNQLRALRTDYKRTLYESLQDSLPDVRLDGIDVHIDNDFGVDLPAAVDDLDNAGIHFYVDVDLYGPYGPVEDFADDCAAVMEVIKAQGPLPDRIEFQWENPQETISMSVSLRNQAQMDWTAEQMAEQTRVWLDKSDDSIETYPAYPDDASVYSDVYPNSTPSADDGFVPADGSRAAAASASEGAAPSAPEAPAAA